MCTDQLTSGEKTAISFSCDVLGGSPEYLPHARLRRGGIRPRQPHSPSVPGAATVGPALHGCDPGKQVNDRKRHLVVCIGGLVITAMLLSGADRLSQVPI
jgi:hypothetical protein